MTTKISMNKLNDIWEPGYKPYTLTTAQVIDMLNRRPELTSLVFEFRAIPEVAEREIGRMTRRAAKVAGQVGGTVGELVIDNPGYLYHMEMSR